MGELVMGGRVRLPIQQRMNNALIWLVETEFRSHEARRLARRTVEEFKEMQEAARRLSTTPNKGQ